MNKNLCASLKKIIVLLVIAVFMAGIPVFADKYSQDQQSGFEAYRKNDWTGAMFFLRKAGSSSRGYDEETLYMLVMSEMYAGEFKSALSDSSLFLQKFGGSQYAPYMQFQKGRALHNLGRNEDAVLVLSDFCHQNQDNELYAAALYWIAEAFYAEYNFDSARALYERISADFPSDSKVTDARYRIEMIEQRQREEKLVYLLKVTGEENLAAREELERQIKLYQTEDKMGLRKNLADAEARIAVLEAQLDQQVRVNSDLATENANLARSAESSAAEAAAAQAQAAASSSVRQDINSQQTVQRAETKTEAPVEHAAEDAGKKGKVLPVYMDYYPAKAADPEVEALKRKAQALQRLLDEQISEE